MLLYHWVVLIFLIDYGYIKIIIIHKQLKFSFYATVNL